jgi:hypothetical protein
MFGTGSDATVKIICRYEKPQYLSELD